MVAGEPERLPPPPFWRTRYFAFVVMAKPGRRKIDPLAIKAILASPARRQREPNGRVRFWGWDTDLSTWIRVVTLEVCVTVHNAFEDHDFVT